MARMYGDRPPRPDDMYDSDRKVKGMSALMNPECADDAIRNLREIAHQIHQENGKEARRSIEIKKNTRFLSDYIFILEEKLKRLENQDSKTIKDLREANRELMQRLEMTMLSNIDLQEQLHNLKQDQFSDAW